MDGRGVLREPLPLRSFCFAFHRMCLLLPSVLLFLPFQFVFCVAFTLFPVFSVSASFPCLECSCLLHQGRAFLPVIADPPMSSCSLPLEKTLRPNEAKPLPALRPQCCSFPLVLCLKYSLLHVIIRGLLETQL